MTFENIIRQLQIDCPKQSIEILDLGSDSVRSKIKFLLTNLQNKFKYTAVDRKSDCLIYTEESNDEIECSRIIHEADWISLINDDMKFEKFENYVPINSITFKEMFKFSFATDVSDFCQRNMKEEKYDVIILSNVLHFLDRESASEVLSQSIRSLKRTGLINVAVLNDEQDRFPRINLYKLSDFNQMKEGLIILTENIGTYNYEFLATIESPDSTHTPARLVGQ